MSAGSVIFQFESTALVLALSWAIYWLAWRTGQAVSDTVAMVRDCRALRRWQPIDDYQIGVRIGSPPRPPARTLAEAARLAGAR